MFLVIIIIPFLLITFNSLYIIIFFDSQFMLHIAGMFDSFGFEEHDSDFLLSDGFMFDASRNNDHFTCIYGSDTIFEIDL